MQLNKFNYFHNANGFLVELMRKKIGKNNFKNNSEIEPEYLTIPTRFGITSLLN